MADSLSSKPWDGSASNYDSAEAYCSACLVDLNDGSGPKVKSMCHLPVKEPGSGNYNRAALGAAAAALAGGRGGGVKIPPVAKKAAAKKLISLYTRFKLPVPDSLKNLAM